MKINLLSIILIILSVSMISHWLSLGFLWTVTLGVALYYIVNKLSRR